MSPQLDLTFEVIPFADWRAGIAPLWNMEGMESRIAMAINGHGHLRYAGRELMQRVLFFPIAAAWRGQRIGWTSIFNVSDEVLRVRGIYVLPEMRSLGVGRRMVEFAENLWPACFGRTLMYARASNIERYRRWGFVAAPGHLLRAFELERTIDEAGVQLMVRQRRVAQTAVVPAAAD
jgi:GNAT superfamily N-acetyltransferase